MRIRWRRAPECPFRAASASWMWSRSGTIWTRSARTCLWSCGRPSVSDRAQLIESANAQAQAIVKKAEERARVLVSEAEIVKAAQQRAGEIVSAAQTEARTVRQTVTDYCDNMLKTTEETMAENAAQVKNVRANLRQSPRKQL